ncbi:MAG: PQQ-dependent sugar dehydrogenase, partial [Chloroflexota bacterium]|nr:PQQ-dependent sugar dehydrogenase [Chloroflexota bacterium]
MRRPSALAVVLLVILGLLLPVDALAAIELPSGFTNQLVVGGVPNPTAIDWLPNGELLIATRGGVVYRFTGSEPAQQALSLGGAVCPGSETGLLGLAVDPQFATDRFIYLYYTLNRGNCNSAAGRANRVARFTMSTQGALSGEQVLIDNIPAVGGNHNGGDLQFGNDRLLYISVGDSGQDFHTGKGQDENGNARRLDVL